MTNLRNLTLLYVNINELDKRIRYDRFLVTMPNRVTQCYYNRSSYGVFYECIMARRNLEAAM